MTKNGTEANLTAKQRKAINALLAEADMDAVCKAVGTSRSTLYRWLKQPAFRAALGEAEADALSTASRGLVRLAEKAITALSAALDKGTTAQQLRAADIVLGRLLQLRELHTLEERVRLLEQRTPEPD